VQTALRGGSAGLHLTAALAGYMACICYGLFLMLGVVGWRSSLLFTRHIYKVGASHLWRKSGLEHITIRLL
jgi:hypothetical protein